MVRTAYDEALRQRLRELDPNQTELAKAIGRNQPWLHKLMNGDGHADIDDFIALGQVFPGWKGSLDEFLARLGEPLPTPVYPKDVARTDAEKKALKLCRATHADDWPTLVGLMEAFVRQRKRHRRAIARRQQGVGRPQAEGSKSRGKGPIVESSVPSPTPKRPA